MLLSILIPFYNSEDYIEGCLESIMSQGKEGIEVILINDGSSDTSTIKVKSLLANYNGKVRFKLFENETNRGLGTSRNISLEKASGKYIYFLDSDDEITPGSLDKILDKVRKYDVDFISFAHLTFKEIKLPIEKRFKDNLILSSNPYEDFLCLKPSIMAWNKCVKTSFIKKHHIYCHQERHEDILWTFLVFLRASNAVYCKDVTYEYIDREKSLSKRIDSNSVKSIIYSIKKVIEFCKEEKVKFPMDLIISLSFYVLNIQGRTQSKGFDKLFYQIKKVIGPLQKDMNFVEKIRLSSPKMYLFARKIINMMKNLQNFIVG